MNDESAAREELCELFCGGTPYDVVFAGQYPDGHINSGQLRFCHRQIVEHEASHSGHPAAWMEQDAQCAKGRVPGVDGGTHIPFQILDVQIS